MSSDANRLAGRLFAPLARDYDRWSLVLSLGQDRRWRRAMVAGLDLPPDSTVLDVAAGTGQVSRCLTERQFRVVALDQSSQMLGLAARKGFTAVLGRAESLPFDDASFDGLTFTYLLRYVADPPACMRELARVVRPGGTIGMVEFGLPRGAWKPLWIIYTRVVLPAVGAMISPGWKDVGWFLGPSIAGFHRRFPPDALLQLWESAGIGDVRAARLSVGGGVVMWGRRR